HLKARASVDAPSPACPAKWLSYPAAHNPLYLLNMTVIIPGVVPHFFVGAAAGVFGNATGGRRGAILGAFAQGLLITFLPVFLLPVLGDIGFANTTFSDADFGALGILLGIIVR
ncbi:PTS transporter subunit IIC, partial [Escherichia coli]